VIKKATTRTTRALIQMPRSSTALRRAPSLARTKKKAKTEARIPTEATSSGSSTPANPNFNHAHGHGRDHGAHIRFKEVGAHAGHVTDIIADVVGDHPGIAGVIFGNARLDLADQIGPHIGGLGVDAAADPGEEGDGAGPRA
jgi:hypothetical protein